MARVRDHTVLSATHTFIHEWSEPTCPKYSVSIHQMAPPERGSTSDYSSLIYRPPKDERLSWICSRRF